MNNTELVTPPRSSIVYRAYVADFIQDAKDPIALANKIATTLWETRGIRVNVSTSEAHSWVNSLPRIAKLIKLAPKDRRIVLCEFNIPTSGSRIDFLLLSETEDQKPLTILIELKQWTNFTEVNWNQFRVGSYIASHPSWQASEYRTRLLDHLGLRGHMEIQALAYLHNLTHNDKALYAPVYNDLLKLAYVYNLSSEDELAKILNSTIPNGEAAYALMKGLSWDPSKNFIEGVRAEFRALELVGSQRAIYEQIAHFVRSRAYSQKLTFIIAGDPGSGKSVVAFKLLLLLIAELKDEHGKRLAMQLMIPGGELRDAMMQVMKESKLANFISGAVMRPGFDAAIIDEGHKAISRDVGRINYARIYESLNFGIVFIDDGQVINKKGITASEVQAIAEKAGHTVHTFEIKENFRHQGERAIIDWINYVFFGRLNAMHELPYAQSRYVNAGQRFKLYGYDSANAFCATYFAYRENYPHASSRISSLWHEGWYFGPANEDGEVPPTVSIGHYRFAWNPNSEWWKRMVNNPLVSKSDLDSYNRYVASYVARRGAFITGEPEPRPEYLAYFNHVQGAEFDHMFVYIPLVFTYENNAIIFHRERLADEVRNSQTWASPNKYEANKTYFLNRLKVLLTRGTKSTHIFAEDQALNDYLRNTIIPE